jgi:hypothetical protein
LFTNSFSRWIDDPLVDPILHRLVPERERARRPVAGVLPHPDQERHVLWPERPEDDRGEGDAQHDHQQDRIEVSDSVPLTGREVEEQDQTAKMKNTIHSNGTANGMVERESWGACTIHHCCRS